MKEQIGVTQPMVTLPFGATNVPDAAGNAFASEPTSLEYVMPWDGSVVAISVAHNAALSTGTITWQPTINGVANTVMQTVTDSSNQRSRNRTNVGKVPFKAGDRIGVSWTKSGTVSATTTDVAALLFVEYDEVRA